MELTAKQQNAVYYLKNKHTTELLYGGGAGGGKSFLGVMWLIEMCQSYPGTRWLMGRSKLKALKETTLNTFFDVTKSLDITSQYNYNAQSGIIYWWNGSEIILKDLFFYPSDPEFDSLGSLEITGAFIDECNQLVEKAWNIVKSRIRYKLDEFGLIPKIMGSCNPAKNWVYKRFYKPFKDGVLRKTRAFVQALLSDNPHVSKHYRDNLLDLDKNSRARLLEGLWEYDSDPNALCEFENISNIWTNDFVKKGKRYITADIALHGSDSFVVIVWEGWRILKIYKIDKIEPDEVVEFIKDKANIFKVPRTHITYDADGLGSYLKGYLKNAVPFHNGGKPIKGENYENLKTQCAYRLAEFINENKLFSSVSDFMELIIEELEQLKRHKADDDGKKKMVRKKDIKAIIGRSPDLLDALLMRVIFDIKPKLQVFTNKLSAKDLGLV